MADVKITQFDDAGTLDGTEKIYLVRGATDYNTTTDAIKARVKGDIVNNLTSGGATKFASAETVKKLDTEKANKATQVIAGNGLTGGGDFSADRTINAESADDGIIVNTDNIKLNIINDLVTSSATRPISATQAKLLYDSYLESLPNVGIAVQQSGDGSASTTINIYTLVATTATITGGTFSGGLTTMAIPARTNTDVAFSLSLSEGLIRIKGLSKINSVTTPTNAPILAREAAWVLPSVMTYFYCTGSNTLSGVLSLPSVMTYFRCFGSNTLSGVLSLPSVMTYFRCEGSNTLTGVLSLPPVMTSFSCTGSNTLTGVLSLPSVMTYFLCIGSNTLTYPSAGVNIFSTTFVRFFIRPQSTWTSAMTDAVLIDAAATVTTTSGEKVFDIRGNAGARTSASDSAKAYLEGIGFTIFTN